MRLCALNSQGQGTSGFHLHLPTSSKDLIRRKEHQGERALKKSVLSNSFRIPCLISNSLSSMRWEKKQSSGLQMEMFNAYAVYRMNINCEHGGFWLIC